MQGMFVASTGQNVGKTTTCLGLLSGLKKLGTVTFMKPVGQEHTEVAEGTLVDKDVALMKAHFNLSSSFADMSPVLVPPGFTRSFLDGEIDENFLSCRVVTSFQHLTKEHSCVLVEGTGHTGVGSVVNLNNAQVASLLNIPILLVAAGGIGSTIDALALNLTLCEKYGAKVLGVILNRVLPEKKEMILSYLGKALKRWNLPILGCVPYDPFLSNPSMKDFEGLFETSLLSGEEHLLRHFTKTRLVATSVEAYRKLIARGQLIITPANREDIILATLTKHWEMGIASPKEDLAAGMILTGDAPPSPFIVEQLKSAEIPMLFAPVSSYTAMKMILSFTAKIRKEDKEKIQEAIDLVESHIDFDELKKATLR